MLKRLANCVLRANLFTFPLLCLGHSVNGLFDWM